MNLKKSDNYLKLLNVAKNHEKVIALILFGSYAIKKNKKNSDIDVCIIVDKNSKLDELNDLKGFSSEKMDVVFYHNLTDMMKFKVFSKGELIVLNDKKKFYNIRRKFLHIYRDNYPFYEYNMKRMLANV